MDEAAFVPVGRVVKPHGLAGEVSLKMEPTLSELPLGLEVWFVPPKDAPRGARIRNVRPGPKGPIVSFEGVDDIDSAASLRGTTVVTRPEDLPEGALEVTWQPIGFSVLDESRGDLGTIREVLETGANDVWIVEGGPFGQVLVPVIESVVISIDKDAERVLVRLLPGLIEEPE